MQYDDYEQFKVALRAWTLERQLFEQNETVRLVNLQKYLCRPSWKQGIVVLISFVGFFITICFQRGDLAFWIVFAGVISFVSVTVWVTKTSRLHHKADLVRRAFSEPEPVYQPPPQQPAPPSKEISELVQKIDVLEESLTKNNENQKLLIDQFNSLKSRLDVLDGKQALSDSLPDLARGCPGN